MRFCSGFGEDAPLCFRLKKGKFCNVAVRPVNKGRPDGGRLRQRQPGARGPSERLSTERQKSSFKPNWIWRDVVAVVVISPADGLIAAPENTIAFGVPKFV